MNQLELILIMTLQNIEIQCSRNFVLNDFPGSSKHVEISFDTIYS